MTVVIATRDRRAEAHYAISRLVTLPFPPQIIVVDNHSSDGTSALLRQAYPGVCVLTLPYNAGAAARTAGARLARTPYVAFSDDDSWWEPGALDHAVAALAADRRVGLVAARVLVGSDGRPDPVSAAMAAGRRDEWWRDSPAGRRAVTGFLACAVVVRRHAFLAAGGFAPELTLGGEEELLAVDLADAGWKLVYEPAAVVRHHPSPQRDAAGRQRMLARNRVLTGWLRFGWGAAAGRTAAAVAAAAGGSRPERQGLVAAAACTGWVVAHRRPAAAAIRHAFSSC